METVRTKRLQLYEQRERLEEIRQKRKFDGQNLKCGYNMEQLPNVEGQVD